MRLSMDFGTKVKIGKGMINYVLLKKRQRFELVILRPFLVILLNANYINIFHKTEIQTVILRCLTKSEF